MPEMISVEEERPVFIIGPKRGGTTLLRRLIDAHSEISIPPPGWFYHFIYPYLYSYGELEREANILELIRDSLNLPIVRENWGITATARQILGLLPERSFRGVFSTLSRQYAKATGASRWGSKAPGEAFWIREIRRDFPKARFVFIYRDGRDASIDLKAAIWGSNNIYSACLVWKRHIEAILAAKKDLHEGSYHELYYERLVGDPEPEVRSLLSFLEVDYEPAVFDYHLKATDGFVTAAAHHAETNQPITDRFVGMYKNLPPRERRVQVAAIGPLLQVLGYEVEEKPRDVGFWEASRYEEEDDHGGLILNGGVELMHELKLKRERRKRQGIWTEQDLERFFGGNH
jgi:hypothetical protein